MRHVGTKLKWLWGPKPVVLYLVILVLIILIPAAIVSLVLLQRNNQAQEDILRSLTNATVEAIMQSVDRQISGMETTLRVLSTSELLLDGNLPEFYRRARHALEGTGNHLAALDVNGMQMFNTRLEYGQGQWRTSDLDTPRLAIAKGQAVLSPVFFGRTAQKWVFNVVFPLPTRPAGVGVLVLTQNAFELRPVLQSRQLPHGWHAALVDHHNAVVSSTPETGLEIGSVLPLREIAASPVAGIWSREILGGESVVVSEQRSSLSNWRVVAWATSSEVERPLDESLIWLAAWSALIALVSTAGVILGARAIAGSVRGLRQDALLLGKGEQLHAKNYPVAEIAQVSLALEQASNERKGAAEEVNFLMRELAHRSKNQMTVITAMAKQTARGAQDVESYVHNFERRILGLARSTDLLLAHGRVGVALGDLLVSQIAPFSPPDGGRVTLAGPLLRLNGQAAQILGMAIHELSTNAVKYGAFAGDQGALSVIWTIEGDQLHLVWRETVSQPLSSSDRIGFGTTVLKSMVGRSLSAEVERHCHDDGIEWRFAIPLSTIEPTRGATGDGSRPFQ